MQPRAFVIMPFGQKPIGGHKRTVDFDRVYYELLEPALQQSGYVVVRADSEVAAGDIRTDMFFELVTADLVVADVSIPNENVYYELGVRHGVCPRGVIVVAGSVLRRHPFDIASDRMFRYESSPFTTGGAPTPVARTRCQPASQCELLANVFKRATAADRETVGSPVYAHLPGLQPVNWDNIETSKAKYFNALQSDWLDLVRTAQSAGCPGDILTLAMNAPTRLHESRILYEAAMALISLRRYSAAERVLRDVIRLDPDHAEAQIQLALVLSHLDQLDLAEQHLRKLSSDFKDRSETADLLGQVLRYLWHFSWKKGKTAEERRQLAKESSMLAVSAVRSFFMAYRADPKVYYAGFNALMLIYLLNEIGASDPSWLQELDELKVFTQCLDELKAITQYVARNQREQAIDDGNYELQFWTTTVLAGILFVDKHDEDSLQHIHEACAIRAATAFQLQSFLERLDLLAELDIRSDFVRCAQKLVQDALQLRDGRRTCHRVFLFAGSPVDAPDHQQPRFSGAHATAVGAAIESVLNEWQISTDDLAICGGMTESDIIFAEACLKLGATVRIMLRDPVPGESDEPLWPFTSQEWHQRFHQLLLDGKRKEVWVDTKHLGSPVEGSVTTSPIDFVTRRHTQWLVNTAETEAEVVSSNRSQEDTPPSSPERLYGLFLWDGNKAADLRDIPFLIRRVSQFNEYQGQVRTINPADVGCV